MVCDRILEFADVSLICGHRDAESQNYLYEQGRTQVKYPRSKHNSDPARAVDLQPYPYPANEVDLRVTLAYIAGVAMAVARDRGIELRWGGDWDRDGEMQDNNFDDLFHLELI